METLRRAALIAFVTGLCLVPGHVATQALDICGCAAIENLPAFDTRLPASYPPGTIVNSTTLSIPVPEDGILRFSSMFVRAHLNFIRNAANTPVTILVQGDAEFDSASGCCWTVMVSGHGGTTGSANAAGVGGLGGPGGSRGGDGAHFALYSKSIGGAGFGAGGGLGGDPSGNCVPGGGQFHGSPDLLPLVGGAGGGGGCSAPTTPTCSGGGGGGGGGGAMMIAVNGSLIIDDFQFVADGAGGGFDSNSACASTGAGGSGGAFRMVAAQLVQRNRAEFYARGNDGGTTGRIRLESRDASAMTAFSTEPGAVRVVGPTPLASPLAPVVTITNVGGVATPAVPQGAVGAVDVTVPVPGATNVNVTTSNVPGGTTVQVTVKPRMGGHPVSESVPLLSCNAAGDCQASATFNLAAGTYVVEARATYRTQ